MKVPVIIGSGMREDNLQKFAPADAFIVGSHFKLNGRYSLKTSTVDLMVIRLFFLSFFRWENALDEERIRKFMIKYFELFPDLANRL
jgi:hypothetical protein